MSSMLLVDAGCSSATAPPGGPEATATTRSALDVIWTDVVGVNAVGNNLTKTAADGWGNAGAASTQSLTSDGYVEFTTAENATNKMVGLTHTVANSGFQTIDFGIFLSAGAKFGVYEDGVYVGGALGPNFFGSYAPGDLFRVQVVEGVVTYLQNDSVFYTSTRGPVFPLVVDASLYTAGSSVDDVTLTTTTPFWQNVVGVSTVGANLTKTGGIGWNAGASTSTSLTSDGYFEFTTAETNTNKMAGLTHAVNGNGYATIDFGIFLTSSGTIDVFEDGTLVTVAGAYAAGDFLQAQVLGSTVTYLQNGTLLYTSHRAPTFPLVADASMYDIGSTVQRVTITGGTPYWRNMVGVTQSGHSLTKTGPGGWNAGASTIASLAGDGYVELTTGETNTNKMAGLTHAVANSGYASIDFALFLAADGSVSVYEDGTDVGTFGSYAAGDVLAVQVTGRVVTYLKNGAPLFTSAKSPTFPLVADASLDTPGATVDNLVVATGNALWQNVVGVSTSGQSLTKTGAAGWNAGASSAQSLTGDGYVEFTAVETNTNEMVGLTHAVTDSRYATIDFGIFLTGGATIDIFEDGGLAATAGSYAAGDELVVQVQGSAVTYWQNGTLLYTSQRAPTFPLVADASLYETGSALDDVYVGEGVAYWRDIVGVTASGQSLTKIAGDGWNAGASTIATIGGDGSLAFTAGEVSTGKMVGLTHTLTNSWNSPLDFAIFLQAGGLVSVYEGGNQQVRVGPYVAGDQFVIQMTGGIVAYLQNGTLLYTSTRSPTFPLVADAELYNQGATIDDVTLAAATQSFWQNIVGVVAIGRSLTKGGSTGWNAGASTIASLSGDGYVEFTTGETNTNKLVGLTHEVNDSGYATIDFGIFLAGTGQVYVFEDGSLVGTAGSYAAGDVLLVQVQGNTVSSLKNGTLLYVSQRAPTFPLVADASLYEKGATVENVTIAAGSP
ncbi:MAG: hypothetical protein ACRELB_22520 [Polyangiaceae bacterium]